jgi:hypothetical protein
MADNLWVQESFIDRTQGHRFGDSDVYETFTDNRAELFRAMQGEYGRCISKVYIDVDGGSPKGIGWVFEKKIRYDDTDERYMQEVWVTLHQAPPTRTVEYHYASVAA